jgi:large subunit ribosomal protein L21
MYAIVDIAGKQFKVEKNKFIYAPLLQKEKDASVEFDNILLLDDDGKVQVGAPAVKGFKVTAKVLEHVKGDKVIVFKKKRRKGYKKKNGHRQDFTKLLIEDITDGTTKKSAARENKSTKKTASTSEKTTSTSKDDLTKIKGIGEVYQKELNKIGYTSYQQIASLSKSDMEKIADAVDGVTAETIESEEWVKQAKALDKK